MSILGNNAIMLVEILTAAFIGVLILLIVKLAQGYWSKYSERLSLDKQFDDALSGELDDPRKNKNGLWRKWNRFWEKRIVDSGINFMAADRDNVGKLVLYFDLGLLAVLSLLFKGSVIGALLIVIASNVIASFVLEFIANKKLDKLSGQVPAFLSALRAANDTSASTRSSLLQAINTCPQELHDELKPVEDQLMAGGQIKQVLMDYYEVTVIDELRFLMACIVLVNESGKDMNEQIKIIQDVVDSRMEVNRHLKQAIAGVMPTIWVATAFIPAMWLYTYIVQPISRAFWFHSFFSWIILLIVLGLYLLGIGTAKHQIDKIKKL